MARKKRWTLEAGRHIYFDGQPAISVGREGDTQPVVADGAAQLVVDLFNKKGVTPDSIFEAHMGYPKGGPYPWDKGRQKNSGLKNKLLK